MPKKRKRRKKIHAFVFVPHASCKKAIIKEASISISVWKCKVKLIDGFCFGNNTRDLCLINVDGEIGKATFEDEKILCLLILGSNRSCMDEK